MRQSSYEKAILGFGIQKTSAEVSETLACFNEVRRRRSLLRVPLGVVRSQSLELCIPEIQEH